MNIEDGSSSQFRIKNIAPQPAQDFINAHADCFISYGKKEQQRPLTSQERWQTARAAGLLAHRQRKHLEEVVLDYGMLLLCGRPIPGVQNAKGQAGGAVGLGCSPSPFFFASAYSVGAMPKCLRKTVEKWL